MVGLVGRWGLCGYHCTYTDLPTLPVGSHLVTLEVPTPDQRPGPYWLSLCVGWSEADAVADVRGIELPPWSLSLQLTPSLRAVAGVWSILSASGAASANRSH